MYSLRHLPRKREVFDKPQGLHGIYECTNRIRPLRLAAKRQRELMCVFMSECKEVFEWNDDDDEVDSEGLPEPSTVVTKSGTPFIKRANVFF